MVFNTGAALLDAIVLAVVSKEAEGTYGYKITQEVRQVIDLSESTLYPVLRRLQKDDCLKVYDLECAGRNRRYYKVTGRGWAQLSLYESEWRKYSDKITGLFEGRTDLTLLSAEKSDMTKKSDLTETQSQSDKPLYEKDPSKQKQQEQSGLSQQIEPEIRLSNQPEQPEQQEQKRKDI